MAGCSTGQGEGQAKSEKRRQLGLAQVCAQHYILKSSRWQSRSIVAKHNQCRNTTTLLEIYTDVRNGYGGRTAYIRPELIIVLGQGLCASRTLLGFICYRGKTNKQNEQNRFNNNKKSNQIKNKPCLFVPVLLVKKLKNKKLQSVSRILFGTFK